MREHLLGYLLGALDPPEHQWVQARLAEDPELERELLLLQRGLAPLADGQSQEPLQADQGVPSEDLRRAPVRGQFVEPPRELAVRTCQFVYSRTGGSKPDAQKTAPCGGFSGTSTWRAQDWIVAAAVLLAASMLIVPAISQSRFESRRLACQDNLHRLGLALLQYSQLHRGYFPVVPQEGPLAVAGMYGPTLSKLNLLESPHLLICPSSRLARERDFRLPEVAEIMSASPLTLQFLQSRMGGSYAYTLGYLQGNRYHGHRSLSRHYIALMADTPDDLTGLRSNSHGDCGQNVLFEDCHVAFLTNCLLGGCEDHLYQNRLGFAGPGIGRDDSVVVRSSTAPIVVLSASGR